MVKCEKKNKVQVIRPEDVRYGNIVEQWKVNRKFTDDQFHNYQGLGALGLMDVHKRTVDKYVPYWEYRPVTLTPEMLTLMGFTQLDKYSWRKGRNFVHYRVGKDVWKCRGGEFQYLHELQNLWRWVTGKELEITSEDLTRMREAQRWVNEHQGN